MLHTLSLSGPWKLHLGGDIPPEQYPDTMHLPGTTSHARKGPQNPQVNLDCLTDLYRFEGKAWFSREIIIPDELDGHCQLFLERTRITTVYLNGENRGTQSSLSAPHLHDLGRLAPGSHTLTILVDNTGYPTRGGHLTSKDTQTNWNGITGRIELQFFHGTHLQKVRLTGDVKSRSLHIQGHLTGSEQTTLQVEAGSFNSRKTHTSSPAHFTLEPGTVEVTYPLGEAALLWDEENPSLYQIRLTVTRPDGTVLDRSEHTFGLRSFEATGRHFTINGVKTFFRGKHDGLVFPRTGFAPTDLESWLKVLTTAREYGINHYRFHTCCPPEAAFEAANRLGIYMEPEVPFWGTITDEGDPNHNPEEQQYLIQEGLRMLEAFGNHPSFVMFSLGNELWGSKRRINEILETFKAFDPRPLYTQGSNNFLWTPDILPAEDFFCHVRFSLDRLLRGSYAMCDAPLGHVQVAPPSTLHDYDEVIVPRTVNQASIPTGPQEVQIQFGTEARAVQAEGTSTPLIPEIPVVSHEIGQYAMFPNFQEIEKYAGSLKARNLETFQQRLEAKGLGHLANRFFEASGKLAVACYREELEAAFRSRKLAGFQLLDLQDFPGQGTALVGILDAFMESKGLIAPREWRSFCSDRVLLARFEKHHWTSGEAFQAKVQLVWFSLRPLQKDQVRWTVQQEDRVLFAGTLDVHPSAEDTHLDLGDVAFTFPEVQEMKKLTLHLELEGSDIFKTYDLWVYPARQELDLQVDEVHRELSTAAFHTLQQGGKVLLFPHLDLLPHSIEGTYCTDFWCYPMFRRISEKMQKTLPVGTHGLLIEKDHPVFRHFPTESHSTFPWWTPVMHSRSLILDDLPRELSPMVHTIDNFERNHKLSFLFECKVGTGKLLVCAVEPEQLQHTPEGRQFLFSVLEYFQSPDFDPQVEVESADLLHLFLQNFQATNP